jgi:hypothetical protein
MYVSRFVTLLEELEVSIHNSCVLLYYVNIVHGDVVLRQNGR